MALYACPSIDKTISQIEHADEEYILEERFSSTAPSFEKLKELKSSEPERMYTDKRHATGHRTMFFVSFVLFYQVI
jgi:hypothetical protein